MNINDIKIETEIGVNMSTSIACKLYEQKEKINKCEKKKIEIEEEINISKIIIDKM